MRGGVEGRRQQHVRRSTLTHNVRLLIGGGVVLFWSWTYPYGGVSHMAKFFYYKFFKPEDAKNRFSSRLVCIINL